MGGVYSRRSSLVEESLRDARTTGTKRLETERGLCEKRGMSIVTRVCLVAWLAVGLSACSQPKPVNTAKVKEAMRCFGREEYGKVPVLLEESGAMNSPQSLMFDFYLGECFYQTNDLAKAQRYFEKAFQTIFNKDEAADRLVSVCEKTGGAMASEPYRMYWTKRLKDSEDWLPDSKWENVQPKGPRDLEEPMIIIDSRFPGGPGIDYSRGGYTLGVSRPSIAVFHLERGIVINIPLQERFDSNNALLYYTKLAKAYRKKAELFKSNKFFNQEEFKAGVRRYVDEHRAVEIPEAEQLAEHYRWKAIVVEARLAAKKKP
jgi:tetratricopeptide (TPR) repeat protein